MQKWNNNFVAYCSFSYFLRFFDSILREVFLSFVLTVIAFDRALFINGEWFPLTYFFFHGASLSRTFLQEIAKLLECSSQLLFKFCEMIFCRDFPERIITKKHAIAIVNCFRFHFPKGCFHNSSDNLMKIWSACLYNTRIWKERGHFVRIRSIHDCFSGFLYYKGLFIILVRL